MIENIPDPSKRYDRGLSRVLLRITLFLALGLGTIAGMLQLGIDLRQEKDAVEINAAEFLDSVTPSAASAVYNYHEEAAEQVVKGLFTQRAVQSVVIVSDGQTYISKSRDVARTLPNFGPLTQPDILTIRNELTAPGDALQIGTIGHIEVAVDRSIVPPAIVNRMFLYFLLATLKNFVLGMILVIVVFAAVTGHIVALTERIAQWEPGQGVVTPPNTPHFLRRTELEALGAQISNLTSGAETVIRELELTKDEVVRSNSKLSDKSRGLAAAVEKRTRELSDANEKLSTAASHDALTALHNRRYFDESAQRYILGSTEFGDACAIVLIDVDHFKAYNDHYGHQAGDDCLRDIAKTLSDSVSGQDILLARYGGEEFVAACHAQSVDEAKALADTLRKAVISIKIPHSRSLIGPFVTVSVGAAIGVLENLGDLENLISEADEALYEAKHKGRNRIEISSDRLQKRVRERRNETEDLLEALETEQFEPFFQPQIDVCTGKIVGAEVLARRVNADGSISEPGTFLGLTEELGKLNCLDKIIFKKSLESVGKWEAAGLTLPRVSLNASKHLLAEVGFVDWISKTVKQYKTQIALELLESIDLDDPDAELLWRLDALREAGLEIEIDDFGTGRTSVLGLMRIAPHRLKLAREIISPMESESRQIKVIENMLSIGRALGIEVVAEGVETQGQCKCLANLGCTIQQGYFHSRPISVTDFENYLSNFMNTNSAMSAKS